VDVGVAEAARLDANHDLARARVGNRKLLET
jgi:hypothetical protein